MRPQDEFEVIALPFSCLPFRILGWTSIRGHPAILMPYYSSGSLDTLLKGRGGLPPMAQALRCVTGAGHL
jgi:hypothetical protein